ncbi:MAG: hypothetical protein AB1402_08020 [Bacillota bacterium]|jgi:hypothetical protein
MRYVVPKRTLTYADTLEAVGLGSLLEEITGSEVRLMDRGDRYVLEGKQPDPSPDWPSITPGYPFIYLKADGEMPAGQVMDYEREREKANQLKEFRQATGKKQLKLVQALAEQGLSEPPSPLPEYRMASFLASMRKGWSSDKQLFRWIKANPEPVNTWAANRLGGDEAIETPQSLPDISNSQVFNPISGKGVHRPKPDSTTAGSISSEAIDPFAEWMKFRGAYKSMLPYRSGGNFKVFVLEPSDIVVSHLVGVFKALRELNLWGGIQLDIEAALRLTEILIHHSDVMGNQIPLRNRRPRDVVRGLHQAYFQSLGTAAALMNYSFAALPSWFEIRNRDDANAFIGIIHEHIGDKRRDGVTGCLRSLNEDHSGDVPVLQQYRKWLTTGEAVDFLDFCYGFALHQMERLGRDEWVKAMSTDNLNIIFGRGYQMQDIIENQGFQSVARAVRNATVYALSFQKQSRRSREVQFGLAQKWKQKIRGGKEELVAAICDFVHQYNWESEKLDASADGSNSGSRRIHHKVKTQELDEVIRLVNDKGAELVGMLLLAYGYARAPRTEQAETESETS